MTSSDDSTSASSSKNTTQVAIGEQTSPNRDAITKKAEIAASPSTNISNPNSTTQVGVSSPSSSTSSASNARKKRNREGDDSFKATVNTIYQVKGRRQLAALVALIAGILMIILIMCFIFWKLSNELQQIELQLEQDREAEALNIARWKLINSSVDYHFEPCTNFYKHACGRFQSTLITYGMRNVVDLANEANQAILLAGLQNPAIFNRTKSKALHSMLNDFKKCVEIERKDEPLWCLNEKLKTDDKRHLLSRVFLEQYIIKYGRQRLDDMRAEVRQMVNSLKEVFTQLVTNSKWMDQQSGKIALKKIKKMVVSVAFEDHLFDDQFLDGHIKLNLKYDIELKESVYVTKVEYLKHQNSLYIYLGILQKPLYDFMEPLSIKYGYLGFIIGHMIAHALDREGSEYDESGNKLKNSWWSQRTKSSFEIREKCFIDQYGNITDSMTGFKLNGEKTLSTNIADNGGIKSAYQALQLSRKDSSRAWISPSEYGQYTDDQLFFYSYAMAWCNTYLYNDVKEKILNDHITIGKYRTNVVLQNSEPFAAAFNCSSDWPMNPKNKCQMW